MDVRFEQISTLPWNINSKYGVGTKVSYDGKCYVSKKDVPVGVNIGMGDYWKKMELNDNVEDLAEAVDDLTDDVEDLQDDVGTLANLSTTDKSSLVGAINEVDGSLIVESLTFHDITFTNNTTIELTCTKEGYTAIGVVGWQLPSVDRTKVTGLIELFFDSTSGKVCANPCCTQTVTGGHISVWVLFAKA